MTSCQEFFIDFLSFSVFPFMFFWPIFMEFIIKFSKTHSIIGLTLWYQHLTLLFILSQWSSHIRAKALFTSASLKKLQQMFYLHFVTSNSKVNFPDFLVNMKNYILNLHKIYALNIFLFLRDFYKSGFKKIEKLDCLWN